MDREQLLRLAERAQLRDLSDRSALEDFFEVTRLLMKEDREAALRLNKKIRNLTGGYAIKQHSTGMFELYNKTLLLAAPWDFDSYMLYTEKNRAPEKRFYQPRRKQLKPCADAMQRLANRELELLAISMPPGVGKSTLALFFLTWLAGRNPDKPMLTGSHANSFLTGVYGEILRMLAPDGEYLWQDVFPGLKVVSTNAKDMMIDVGVDKRSAKRFATLEFTSVGAGNAGKVRAENLLYCDDLVDGLESALSRDRMDKLWGLYSTDLRQRKIGDCVELHIATRWSVHDVIGRLERMYGDNGKSEFIVMPALDENDESLFDYPIEAGLSTKFLHEQREAMDDASWRALYLNQPIEREGQLYREEELRRYFTLPDREPDAVIAVCDTKDKGADYCVLPVAYQYGQDFYIEDVVCENFDPSIVDINLAEMLVNHKVQMCQFESNSAGGKTAEKVQNMVKEKGGITKITTKWTSQNKETKIIVNSPFAKEHFLFKDNSVIKKNKEYRTFLNFLCGYTMAGKNKHDDVPDAVAQLALYVQNFTAGRAKVINRPW